MNNKKNLILISIGIAIIISLITLVILYNTGVLGYDRFGPDRMAEHHRWMRRRGFDRGHHGPPDFEGRNYGPRGRHRGPGFGFRRGFGFGSFWLIIGIILFAGIIITYLIIRNKNTTNSKLKCSECGSVVENTWITCPHCGNSLKKNGG